MRLHQVGVCWAPKNQTSFCFFCQLQLGNKYLHLVKQSECTYLSVSSMYVFEKSVTLRKNYCKKNVMVVPSIECKRVNCSVYLCY